MNKKSQIRELFKDFACPDFFDWGKPFVFKCEDADLEKCACQAEAEPIWTPSFGDKKSKIMLIGEAPSTTGGIGPHLGGLWQDWQFENEGDVFKQFRDFFQKQLGYVPYFTDLVKCGPSSSGNKRLIRQRAPYCIQRFLLNEIKIIDPVSIYCIGRTAYDFLKRYQQEKAIDKDVKLKLLIHYSRQANLPLNQADKELIWKWQLGELAKDNIGNISLSKFSFFHPNRKNNKSKRDKNSQTGKNSQIETENVKQSDK